MKSKNLNTWHGNSFYWIMAKSDRGILGVTFSPNLMQMVKSIAQIPIPENVQKLVAMATVFI